MMTLIQIGAVAAALLAIAAVARGLWRANKRLVRISNAVGELFPNGGHSVKDDVTAIRTRVDSIDGRVGKLEKRGRFPWL